MENIKTLKSEILFSVVLDMFKENKNAKITVTGNSMYPFMRDRKDQVELSKTTFNDIKRGDIVLIKRDTGTYVMHRVLKKKADYFYMVGDAQQWIEGPLYEKHLIAIVTTVFRNDKIIKCSNIWWKLITSIWLVLRPFRYFLLKVFRVLNRIRKFVFKKNSM